MSAPVPADQWRWFGTAAHFICGQWCRFHLATQVGDYLVSTVGEYIHPSHSGGSEATEAAWLKKNWPGADIGLERKYETMVFRAGAPCAREGCGCGLPSTDGHEIDAKGYNDRRAAIEGHMRMCQRWAAHVDKPKRAKR